MTWTEQLLKSALWPGQPNNNVGVTNAIPTLVNPQNQGPLKMGLGQQTTKKLNTKGMGVAPAPVMGKIAQLPELPGMQSIDTLPLPPGRTTSRAGSGISLNHGGELINRANGSTILNPLNPPFSSRPGGPALGPKPPTLGGWWKDTSLLNKAVGVGGLGAAAYGASKLMSNEEDEEGNPKSKLLPAALTAGGLGASLYSMGNGSMTAPFKKDFWKMSMEKIASVETVSPFCYGALKGFFEYFGKSASKTELKKFITKTASMNPIFRAEWDTVIKKAGDLFTKMIKHVDATPQAPNFQPSQMPKLPGIAGRVADSLPKPGPPQPPQVPTPPVPMPPQVPKLPGVVKRLADKLPWTGIGGSLPPAVQEPIKQMASGIPPAPKPPVAPLQTPSGGVANQFLTPPLDPTRDAPRRPPSPPQPQMPPQALPATPGAPPPPPMLSGAPPGSVAAGGAKPAGPGGAPGMEAKQPGTITAGGPSTPPAGSSLTAPAGGADKPTPSPANPGSGSMLGNFWSGLSTQDKLMLGLGLAGMLYGGSGAGGGGLGSMLPMILGAGAVGSGLTGKLPWESGYLSGLTNPSSWIRGKSSTPVMPGGVSKPLTGPTPVAMTPTGSSPIPNPSSAGGQVLSTASEKIPGWKTALSGADPAAKESTLNDMMGILSKADDSTVMELGKQLSPNDWMSLKYAIAESPNHNKSYGLVVPKLKSYYQRIYGQPMPE